MQDNPTPQKDQAEVRTMQAQPMHNQPDALGWLLRGLALIVAIGVLWAIVAGVKGYALGNPPTGLNAVASCYHVTRVDFVVPMWKAADPSQCPTLSVP